MGLFKTLTTFFTIVLITACGGGGGGGGGGSAPTPQPTPAPTPAPGPQEYIPDIIEGKAIDGYLSNTLVWIDENYDFIRQEEELSAVTEEGGVFKIDPTQRLLDLGILVPEPTPEPTPEPKIGRAHV